MPFKSKAQQKFLFAKHPTIAKRWAKKYGVSKSLPNKVSKSKSKMTSLASKIFGK